MAKQFYLLLCLVLITLSTYAQDLEVHEWGTFTVVQNDKGETLVGVNTDDEPIPNFVHKRYFGINPLNSIAPSAFSKGLPRYLNSKMKVRLETPVVYFYPKNNLLNTKIDFQAEFINGIISEVYPNVSNVVDINVKNKKDLSLAIWKSIDFSVKKPFPLTNSSVWLEPRKTKSTPIQVGDESEQYIFYRGLGEMDIPLHVISNRASKKIEIFSEEKDPSASTTSYKIGRLWYVNVDADKKIQFKNLKGFGVDGPSLMKKLEFSSQFSESEKTNDSIALFSSMKIALIEQGLFADEAEAMLKTWEQAYFKQSGSRIFFMVPRVWVDRNLPIKVSVDSKIERAMIGRIEIISDEQNGILQEIRNAKIDPTDIFNQQLFKNYDLLGRFRDAIVNDSNKESTNPNLSLILSRLLVIK
jgi:hypothetical protein